MTDQSYRDADTHTNFRVPNETHARIKDPNRASETLAATIDRALDALEREQALPDAVVTALMSERYADSDTGAEDTH